MQDGGDTVNERRSIDLITATGHEREAFYREVFQRDIPFKHLAAPDLYAPHLSELCEVFPQLKEDIVDAYIDYATFVVKVWSNYDGAAKVFFNDHRIADCGKVVLTPEHRELVDLIGSGRLLKNVRFEIGTAFRTLARLTIEIRETLDGGLEHDIFLNVSTCQDHPALVHDLQDLQEDMKEMDITSGKQGFSIGDIDDLAGWFIKKPSAMELASQRSWSDRQTEEEAEVSVRW